MYQAACYGNVGASFAVEQTGLPELNGHEEGEAWNDVNPHLRVKNICQGLRRTVEHSTALVTTFLGGRHQKTNGLAEGKHVKKHIIADKLSYTHKSMCTIVS